MVYVSKAAYLKGAQAKRCKAAQVEKEVRPYAA